MQELINKIKSAPINPVPEVKQLLYTFDWKSFIEPNLSNPSLKNHSNFGAFQIKKENGLVKFRGKRYPYENEWTPETGICLLEPDVVFSPVKPAETRLDKLQLDKVFRHLQD